MNKGAYHQVHQHRNDGVSEEEKKQKGAERTSEEIKMKNFQSL